MLQTELRPSDPQTEAFTVLFNQLVDAWSNHEDLRAEHRPIRELADSSQRLNQARGEMWDWWNRRNDGRSF